MSSRIKQPPPETAALSHAHIETREFGAAMDYVSRCLVSKIRVSDAETVAIVSETGLNGSDLIQFLTDGASKIYNQPATAEVDISATGLGGRVNGATLVDGDYLLWAFLDPTKRQPFVGFGATKRPVETCTGISSGTGAKGSTTIYGAIAGANGTTFSVGSRVIVHQGDGTDWTKDWNQGKVISNGSDTLEIEMDNESYGFAIADAPMMITQTDRYEPIEKGKGIFGNYRYAYLGSAQRFDDAITYTRQRGEWYNRPTSILLNSTASAGLAAAYIVDTGMFMGADTREMQVHVQSKRTADKQFFNVYLGARVASGSNPPHLITTNNGFTTTFDLENVIVRSALRGDGTGATAWFSSTQAGNIDIFLHGWHETRF